MLTNYKVVIQFDGTDFCGWQYQKQDHPTIQAEITRVLQIIAKKKILVTGSSRTDAGVHSLGLTANFHLPIAIQAASLQRAMNSLLPDEIRIVFCEAADKSFNARFGSKGKTYQYRIFFGQVPSPLDSRYYHHIPYPLDLTAMRRSLKHFKGEKDFTSFTSGETDRHKIRCIDRITMKVKGEEILFTVSGKSFLRYMVRNIIGTIIDVGRGKIAAEEIPGIFAAKDRRRAGQTAPAKGLVLVEVFY